MHHSEKMAEVTHLRPCSVKTFICGRVVLLQDSDAGSLTEILRWNGPSTVCTSPQAASKCGQTDTDRIVGQSHDTAAGLDLGGQHDFIQM